MKKLVFALCFLSLSAFAQDDTEVQDSLKSIKPKVEFAWGINFIQNDNFALNEKLNNAGISSLNNNLLEWVMGFDVMGEKTSGALDFGFAYGKNDNATSEAKQYTFSLRGRYHYNFLNTEKAAITAGGGLTYATSQVDIFTKGNTYDLDNLNLASGNHLDIRNNMLYAGPSLAVYVFRDKWFSLRLNAGYEFALTNGKYKSDFASISNPVKESGNNRFVFGISLL